jgi:hypothetical protein
VRHPRRLAAALAVAAVVAAPVAGCSAGPSRSVVVGASPTTLTSPAATTTTTTTAASVAPATSAATAATATDAFPSTTALARPAPSSVPSPTTTPAPPRVVAMAVDAASARATITFDQPVRPGAGDLAPLYLVVFGDRAGCSVPQGNGHAPVDGSGTPVLSLPATSLVQGTNYVEIAAGFATSLGGVPSQPMGCTAVTSSTAPLPIPTTTLPPDAPAVVSAVMDAAAGTVTVTFDQAVNGASPLDLVVFGGDAGCTTPAGNAQSFVSGAGTVTITATVTSLVSGTTYIAIASGWVTSARDPAAVNKPLGCTPVHAA